MSTIQLDTLIPNEKNPRSATESQLKRLQRSIKDFEAMMRVEQITIDENNLILDGNHRYAALIGLGYTEVPENWIKRVDHFTEEQKKEYIVRKNVHNADFVMEMFKDDDWKDEDFDEWLGNDSEVLPAGMNENLKTHTVTKNTALVVGPFNFTITIEDFKNWVNQLGEQGIYKPEDIERWIKSKLSLEGSQK